MGHKERWRGGLVIASVVASGEDVLTRKEEIAGST